MEQGNGAANAKLCPYVSGSSQSSEWRERVAASEQLDNVGNEMQERIE